MEDKKTPGQVLREYREAKGMTMDEFGRVLRCAKCEISLYENDKKMIGKLRRVFWSTVVPDFTPAMLTAEGQTPCDG